jgi:leader peptidase (prepilin peptidase)/N-methyltransferase
MIEFLTALLFLAVRMKFGWSVPLFIKHWPFVSILLAITFIDLEFRMIPDVLSLGGLALGLLTAWIGPYPGWLASLTGAALGFGIFYSLAWIYQKLNHRAGLGGGDIKLIAMLGAFLGPSGVFVTILISSVFGSLVGVLWAISSRQKDLMKFAIPFGPFLVLGALSYYLLGDLLWFQFMIPM